MKKVFWEIVFSLMSLGSVAAVTSPNVPKFFYWLGCLYIFLMLGAGVLTFYATRVVAWCDKKLEVNKDE